jgi:hypothetical protein
MLEYRSHLLNGVNEIRKQLNELPQESLIRKALNDERLNEIERTIQNAAGDNELGFARYPPLFCFLLRNDKNIISGLESNITLVVNHAPTCNDQIINFLKADEQYNGKWQWLSGIFDLAVKARILSVISNKKCVELESIVNSKSDKKCDVIIKCKSLTYCIESTVLNQSKEDEEVYKRWMNDIKNGGSKVMCRPGKFDPPNSKGPSPYYDCWRTYAKVYDKIAHDLNPQKTQMSSNEPNLLILLNEAERGCLLGIQWAIDELFIDQPAGKRNGPIDISLAGWIEHTAREKKIDSGEFCKSYYDLISAPRKISGILIFENNRLMHSQINHHATHKLSHSEMACFDKIFEQPFDY